MKTTYATTAMVGTVGVLAATPAWAAGGEPMGLWTILLLGFGALVILLQAVPAVVLFVSMLGTVFTRGTAQARTVEPAEPTR